MTSNQKQFEKVEKYLTELLTIYNPYVLLEEEKKVVARDKTAFISQKLLSKRFRKQKLHPDTINEITSKLTEKIKENKPVYFTIPFGGYKHYWNPSHPTPDWAEVFSLKFLTE